MRKVVLYELLSLDGVAESPDEFILDWDDVMSENLGRVIGAQDCVILGRRLYDEWAEFWPDQEIEPFASFINGVQKYVVTSTDVPSPWTNTTAFAGPVEELVATLRQGEGGDIGLHGSITLCRSLLALGLVDELRLVIAPTVVNEGRRLFDDTTPRRFEVTRNLTSPTGYLLVDLRAS